MARVWFAKKSSTQHHSNFFEVPENPATARGGHTNSSRNKTSTCWRFGCSRSVANLKDIVHGRNHLPNPSTPLTNDVVVRRSGGEVKITALRSGGTFRSYGCGDGPLADPAFLCQGRNRPCVFKKFGDFWTKRKPCSQNLNNQRRLEDRHACNDTVTKLEEDEYTTMIVKKICQSSFSNPKNGRSVLMIERILKVHHLQITLTKFEEYRESVKARASKLPTKHPRCIADGNELLRFHGTTLSCSLGDNGSSTLCSSPDCNGCRIIKHAAFSTRWQMKEGAGGVFTASACERAIESIASSKSSHFSKKVVLVCRVIAGRVHKPMDNLQEMIGLAGFDSVAGKGSRDSNFEELYLLNPRALLPCFVVICRG